MSVTVYSKPACFKCKATIHYLDQIKVPYQVIDIEEDKEAKMYVEGLGYKQAPVVITDDDSWSDFHLTKILALKQTA